MRPATPVRRLFAGLIMSSSLPFRNLLDAVLFKLLPGICADGTAAEASGLRGTLVVFAGDIAGAAAAAAAAGCATLARNVDE